jgi:hypothetical protein
LEFKLQLALKHRQTMLGGCVPRSESIQSNPAGLAVR